MTPNSPRPLDRYDGVIAWPVAGQTYAASASQRTGHAIRMLFSLIVIAAALAAATTACAPIPCPAGYGDPHWCEHSGGGGGGGSAS
jgi:hypothetical protein